MGTRLQASKEDNITGQNMDTWKSIKWLIDSIDQLSKPRKNVVTKDIRPWNSSLKKREYDKTDNQTKNNGDNTRSI